MNQVLIKKYALIIIQIGCLYIISMCGDLVASLLKLPIPGSIIGLILLFSALHFNIMPDTFVKEGAGFLLVILPLFFIPAIVGIVQYPELLTKKGVILIISVMVSTFLTMIVTGRISQWNEKKQMRKEG